ncbi:hypothetical protein [Novosphingobium huizhouense]|uniref:hypothetical protein n=1 Tax=Novosphingobium huizhouense TaxID=2866625 RepID=UPI001CD826A1|nr:hypothetical protein [Novosphingobium huizhouense]
MEWRVRFQGRMHARFVASGKEDPRFPRCVACGQLDEPEIHDAAYCPALGGALPLTEKAKAFVSANQRSGVVLGSVQPNGGVYYRLRNGTAFRLTPYETRAVSQPHWDFPSA